MIQKAYAGGGEDYYMPQQVQRKLIEYTVPQSKPKTLEQKAKDTVIFMGENWGYGTLLLIILTGGILRKRIMPWVLSPKQQLKKWINS